MDICIFINLFDITVQQNYRTDFHVAFSERGSERAPKKLVPLLYVWFNFHIRDNQYQYLKSEQGGELVKRQIGLWWGWEGVISYTYTSVIYLQGVQKVPNEFNTFWAITDTTITFGTASQKLSSTFLKELSFWRKSLFSDTPWVSPAWSMKEI